MYGNTPTMRPDRVYCAPFRSGLCHRVFGGVLLGMVTAFVMTASGAAAEGSLIPRYLRCEYLEDPLGIDVEKPRLSWLVSSPERGAAQSAYQVLVASSPEQLANDRGSLWDSGKVASDDTAQIVYEGEPLESRQRC